LRTSDGRSGGVQGHGSPKGGATLLDVLHYKTGQVVAVVVVMEGLGENRGSAVPHVWSAGAMVLGRQQGTKGGLPQEEQRKGGGPLASGAQR
jgi:hypothetical protein